MRIAFLAFLFTSTTSFSKILIVDYAKVKKESFTLANVCKVMAGKETLLSSVHNLVNVDCMGELFKIQDFCQKQFKETPYLVRGYIEKETKTAKCIFSQQAIVKWECPSKGKLNCEKPAKAECAQLRLIYAATLPIYKSFYTEEGPDKILSCYYNGAKEEKLEL